MPRTFRRLSIRGWVAQEYKLPLQAVLTMSANLPESPMGRAQKLKSTIKCPIADIIGQRRCPRRFASFSMIVGTAARP